MPVSKEERSVAAKKHLSLMRGVFGVETKASVEAVEIFEDGEGRELNVPEACATETTTEVTTQFAAAVLGRLEGRVLIVDPASFTRPGGNYEGGSFGPEQALCSDSNLYPILQGIKAEYHDKNRGYARGMLFTDRAAYVPGVIFNRDGVIRKADVLVIPEPNRERAIENHRSEAECNSSLENRIETLMRIAAAKECDTLAVGAFGCGRQGFPVSQVIELFKKWIGNHQGVIPHIVFAVSRANFEAFDAAFGMPSPAIKEVTAEPAEEETELFDPDDLPEGVTFR